MIHKPEKSEIWIAYSLILSAPHIPEWWAVGLSFFSLVAAVQFYINESKKNQE